MSYAQLLSLYPQRVARVWRRFVLRRRLLWADRYLELTSREIDEKIQAKRDLQWYRLQVRQELADLN